MNEELLITILTPTYNRKNDLERLAKSINEQTNSSFQWLIIDDGSKDGTKEKIKNFNNDKYEIDYYYKQNGGKHTALNYAHRYIKGKYVCIVDSDDQLTPDAIETISQKIKQYDNYKNIGCLSFQRGDELARPLNSFPNGDTISNHIEFRVNQHRKGDCFEVVRTEVFKKYKFPVFKNEKFMSEGYLWATIAKHYNTVYINKIIYKCTYQKGGLTKTGRPLRIKCPNGGMANSNAYLSITGKRKLKIKYRIKQAILYDCYSKFAQKQISIAISNCENKSLATICYPLGLLLYFYWRSKYLTDKNREMK